MLANAETVNNYADLYTSALDELCNEVLQYTLHHHPKAHMVSGKMQGVFLGMVSKLMQPNYILEIGTFTGFSALCLAKGLKPTGELHTIEFREADAETARQFFLRAAQSEQIKLHTGDALKIIPHLKFEWDIIFIDADKTGYINYYELTLPLLKKGGIIIADNVLFHGEVMAEPVKGKNALAMQAFNQHILQDERVEHVLLAVRDGLQLIRKK